MFEDAPGQRGEGRGALGEVGSTAKLRRSYVVSKQSLPALLKACLPLKKASTLRFQRRAKFPPYPSPTNAASTTLLLCLLLC